MDGHVEALRPGIILRQLVAAHELGFTDPQARMQDLAAPIWRHLASHRRVLEGPQDDDLAAEDLLVEAKRFLAAAVEVEVGGEGDHHEATAAPSWALV